MVNGYTPATLKEALERRAEEAVTPYAGGTDLMLAADEDASYLFLNKLAELKRITVSGGYVRIGAACTYTQVMESPLAPELLRRAVSEIAAPAIRNLGTLGGNLCNASPKADGALALFAANAAVTLSSKGGERTLPIREFYLGRNKTVLQPNELLTEILVPDHGLENYYFKKIGARNALAISRVAFAGVMQIEGGTIRACTAAFGAVMDVTLVRPEIDAMLLGKTIAEAKTLKEEYLKRYEKEIKPIRGRVSAEYRKTVCMNLLGDFLEANGI